MTIHDLAQMASDLVADGKGILAAAEIWDARPCPVP
jgi:hypothetical protein